MSPNTYIDLLAPGILGAAAVALTLLCAWRLRGLWAAAKQGHMAIAAWHFAATAAMTWAIVQVAFNPPWPIDWNAPIPCQHDCGWAFYYVGIIAFLQAWAIPALLATTAMGIVLLRAVLQAEPFTKIRAVLGIRAFDGPAEPMDSIEATRPPSPADRGGQRPQRTARHCLAHLARTSGSVPPGAEQPDTQGGTPMTPISAAPAGTVAAAAGT